eukprot:9091983-Karenia_brevis.AAC.1
MASQAEAMPCLFARSNSTCSQYRADNLLSGTHVGGKLSQSSTLNLIQECSADRCTLSQTKATCEACAWAT